MAAQLLSPPTSRTDLDEVTALWQALRRLGEREAVQRLDWLNEHRDADGFHVVVFGEFNCGKSTLINALMGREILPAKLVPTTGHVTRILWARHDEVRVRTRSGDVEVCPLSKLDSLSLVDGTAAREDVDLIEVAADCPLLESGLTFVDTPGIQDCRTQTERTERALLQADLVLALLDATQLLSQEEQAELHRIQNTLGKPVVPVLNKLNLVNPCDVRELRARLNAWSGECLIPVCGSHACFEVNALGALKQVMGLGECAHDDLEQLSALLASMTCGRFGVLRQRARVQPLYNELDELGRANAETLCELVKNVEALRKERRQQRSALRTVGRRLDVAEEEGVELLLEWCRLQLAAAGRNLFAELHAWNSTQIDADGLERHEAVLRDVVGRIEGEVASRLQYLVGDALPAPAPVPVLESVTLYARINQAEAEEAGNGGEGSAIGGGLVGGLVCQFLIPIPGVGFQVGMLAGYLLGKLHGVSEERYLNSVMTPLQASWNDIADTVVGIVEQGFRDRLDGLRQQVDAARSRLKTGRGDLQNEIKTRRRLEIQIAAVRQAVQE